MSSISDRLYFLRDRVLSDARFQRWAATFPLTRFIAERRASALFDLSAGFVYSQVLFASVRIGLFDALKSQPQTVSELAPKISLSIDATQRLLDAATALRLVEKRRHLRYGLGIHGASLVGNPAVARMIEHHALLYSDMSDPVALLRGERGETSLHKFWSYSGRGASDEANVAAYSELMASSLALIAEDIIEAYPHDEHRSLLDVGGGDGAFLEAAATRAPHLSLTLFDLPPVVVRGRERFARAGLSSRANVVGGDVFRDPLPRGADLVSLVRIIHDHDDAQALEILRAVHRALEPGGVLLLAEPMSDTPNAEPMGDAYFGFYLLAMGQGRPRSADTLRDLLLRAGFQRVSSRNTRRPMLVRLLVALRG